MKTYIRILFIALLSQTIISCSNKDIQELYEPIIKNEIKTDIETVRLKTKESISVNILEGNETYSVFSLDSNIATVDLKNNNLITIHGNNIGSTAIVITDQELVVKKIPISIYQYDNIILENNTDNIILNIKYGSVNTSLLNIIEGNGNYQVSTTNEDLIKANMINDKSIEITTENGNIGGHCILLITDQSNCKKEVNITVIPSVKPYSLEEVTTLKDMEFWKNMIYFNNSYSEYDSKYTNTYINNINIIECNYSNPFTKNVQQINISFKGARTNIGLINEAYISYENFPRKNDSSQGKQKLDYFEIVHIKNGFILAIFSYINNHNTLETGYVVFEEEVNTLL